MGLLQRLSSVAAPPRVRADGGNSFSKYSSAFFAGDDLPGSWSALLTAAGVDVTPELAMTLSAYYCGVTTYAYDLATLPLQVFKHRDDGGKDRVKGGIFSNTGGIGSLVYRLRWQPNNYQTWTEYMVGQVAQFELRGRAYAEIVDGPSGFLEQLLPRHPDRVTQFRLPNGSPVYRLAEALGPPRWLTNDEMHVVRDISLDGGSTSLSKVSCSAAAIATIVSADRAAAKFFKSGMTAAVVATYKGDMEDEDEDALHKSISRYGAGVENSFGVLLVPDDVTINNLGVDPEKAQMMSAREWGVREVARFLRMPNHKLGIKDAGGYATQYQAAIDYVVGGVRPRAVTFEQAIQRDLILAKDTYFTEFQLAALLRGDPQQQADFLSKMIEKRVMRPSEARLILNMNPDEALDKLSEGDMRPGTSGGQSIGHVTPAPLSGTRAAVKATLSVADNAVRCLRRERAAVERLAHRHASDVEGWQNGIKAFYAEHAGFVAQTMRMDVSVARGYAAQHGSEFMLKGIVLIDGEAGPAWERYEADELVALALSDGNSVDDFFERRLVDTRLGAQTTVPVTVRVESPVHIAKDAVAVDARSTTHVDARTSVAPPKIDVDARSTTTVAAPHIEVQPAAPARVAVTIEQPARTTEVHVAEVARDTKVHRNAAGEIDGSTSTTETVVTTTESPTKKKATKKGGV